MTFLKAGVLLSVILAILIPNTLQASAQLQQQQYLHNYNNQYLHNKESCQDNKMDLRVS